MGDLFITWFELALQTNCQRLYLSIQLLLNFNECFVYQGFNMIFSIRLLTVFAMFNLAIASQAMANSVFANKNKSAHELSSGEQQAIQSEFDSKFASAISSSLKVNSKDPWKAKEQRAQSSQQQRTATWGECRESALKNRFGCYRERKAPYQCERYYEARIKLCDDNL